MENETKEIYKNNFTEYLLCLALDIGEDMLKSGGEISRVENTIERICSAYGATHTEVFTIVSVIHASVRMPDGSYSTQMRRVKSTGINFNELERLNSLSRHVCESTPPLEEFEKQYKSIKNTTAYPKYITILAYGIAAGSFALFFGGGVTDALVAFLAGVLIFFIESLPSKRLNGIAKVFISSFATAMIAAASCLIGIGNNGAMIIIGTIMLLVPGVTIGTAMRDIFYGDMLSGTLKFLQACLTALMIALGYCLAAAIVGGSLI